MGRKNGQLEVEKFRNGKELTSKQSIKAHCYMCNGDGEDSNEDCKGHSCALYSCFKKWLMTKKASPE